MEGVEAEVKDRAGDREPVDHEVALGQVPATWPDDEGRCSVVEAVLLALRARERDLPLDRVDEVLLALDHVPPGGRVRVLEVGHEHGRAGVERVDDHLPVGRTGDLDLAHPEVMRDLFDPPLAVFPDVRHVLEEVERAAVAQPFGDLRPVLEQAVSLRFDLVVEPGEEREGVRGEDVRESLVGRRLDVDRGRLHRCVSSHSRA